jgi:hypothetical protein
MAPTPKTTCPQIKSHLNPIILTIHFNKAQFNILHLPLLQSSN